MTPGSSLNCHRRNYQYLYTGMGIAPFKLSDHPQVIEYVILVRTLNVVTDCSVASVQAANCLL
jgi:hypothetical protein